MVPCAPRRVSPRSDEPPADPFRRRFLGILGATTLSFASGCTPVHLALGHPPSRTVHREPDRLARVLRAFVATVLADRAADGGSAEILTHPDYPFAPYAALLADDLARRTRRLTHADRFQNLSLALRTRVVQSGLDAGGIARRLYTGAIHLVQVAFYAGLPDDDGCSLIGFEGGYRPIGPAELTYPHAEGFFGPAATADGNAA